MSTAPRSSQNSSPPRRESWTACSARLPRRRAQYGVSVQWARPVYQTAALAVAAYTILFLPRAMVAWRSGLAAAPTELIEASRSLRRELPRHCEQPMRWHRAAGNADASADPHSRAFAVHAVATTPAAAFGNTGPAA